MREFNVVKKTFVKSKNSTKKIYLNYTYSLIIFILTIIIYNIFNNNISYIKKLSISILITTISTLVIEYIMNLFTGEKRFKVLFTEDNIIPIALILSLFSVNIEIIIIILSIFISLIIRKSYQGINISSSLYGILIIMLYLHYQNELITPLSNLKDLGYIGTYNEIVKSSGSILSYLIGSTYLSPILSVLGFIYLFYKKSIKYNIVIYYNLTFIIIMLLFGLFNNMSIWYVFFQITTGNLLFLSIYCLPDFRITPQTREGQMLYGILLALITTILRFIIPDLSVILTLIIGPLLLTKIIDKLSIKIKYNHKLKNLVFISISILILIITILLSIII